MKIGDKVRIRSTGYEGIVTAIRKNLIPSDLITDGRFCEHNSKNKVPDYNEIDGHIQVHPSKVEVIR